MRLEYILTIWVLILASLFVIFGSGYMIKPRTMIGPIEVEYVNDTIKIYLNTDVVIRSLTIYPNSLNYTYDEIINNQVRLETCPTAIVLDTDRGYYKVFDVKC
ncbi:MAG: hypothetical protein NZ908_01400 [Candidatus Micrarchaeota archaeon]|nr:hypothetical protein [Candidatus Micrarchaeota archaeon]MCX8154718.1 hypothetical protein [Candidatus Micrarchaeota archaeon]